MMCSSEVVGFQSWNYLASEETVQVSVAAVFSIAQYLGGSKYQNQMLLVQILPYQWGV